MKIKVLLTSVALSFALVAPLGASEWEELAGCSNETYTLSFVVDIERWEVYQFTFSINGVKQDSSKWEIENGKLDSSNQTLVFETRALDDKLQNIFLDVKGKHGQLKLGENVYEVKCDLTTY